MAKQTVTFDDIQNFPYAMPAGAAFTECELSVVQLYEQNGHKLEKVHYKAVDSLTDLIFTETKDDEVLILGPSPKLPKNMDYRNFDPPLYQEFYLVYLENNRSPLLQAFIDLVKTHLQEK